MKKVFIFLCTLFLIVFTINATNTGKTIVAVADPWPPFVDKENPTDGLSLEIIRAAFKTQGYEVKMEYVPWARALNGVKDGTYDIIPDAWFTVERKKFFLFGEPYVANELKFIKRKGDPFEFDTLQSLEGKLVGTVRGYAYGDEFLQSQDFKREEVVDLMLNIKKLIAGRIDLTIDNEIAVIALIKQVDPSLLLEIEFVKTPLSRDFVYIMAGLKNPRHKEIIKAFNNGIAKIKANGTYNKICEKYGFKISK